MTIRILRDGKGPGARYLGEILSTFGLCFHEIQSSEEILAQADAGTDLLILPAGAPRISLADFLEQGGRVIVIQPRADQLPSSGFALKEERTGEARLRFVRRVCPASRGASLWALGTFHLYETPPDSRASAYLLLAPEPGEEYPAITDCRIGRGRLVIYAYDPALCVARLRQGYPERANFLPAGELTPRIAFLQRPHPPTDTFWQPTADLHAMGFCGVIRDLMADVGPLPALWHLPDAAPSILLFSGDEDHAGQEFVDGEMKDIEAVGGAMSLYVIPDLTSMTPQDLENYESRGHSISVHPNLTTTASRTPEEQLARAAAQVRLFREKFQKPVRTLRNHSYMWPGYVELPELWERLGIGMDANTTAVMRGESKDFGPFARLNTALPMRYVREDGSLIDVFQQPTQINDDILTHPTNPKSHKYGLDEFSALFARILGDAIRITHSPLCVNIHPGNYPLFSGPFGREILRQAREAGLPIWSLDQWHNFWRARSSWRISRLARSESGLLLDLAGPPCPGLTLAMPQYADGRALTRIAWGQAALPWKDGAATHGNVLVTLPEGISEISLSIEYKEHLTS